MYIKLRKVFVHTSLNHPVYRVRLFLAQICSGVSIWRQTDIACLGACAGQLAEWRVSRLRKDCSM